jgi:hypothetical protein
MLRDPSCMADKKFYDSEAIKISRCPISSGIPKMEQSVPGQFPRTIPRPFYVEIGSNFLNKEFTIECFFWLE